jgi:UDP:flavonoid glycosyltransferase YjiC (YdhE family)
VLAEEYVPLAQLLPYCSLVICHGGAGTTLAALSRGIPLLLTPQGADQFYIAGRAVAAGAGQYLNLRECGEQVLAAIEDTTLREGARALQREVRGLPSPDEAVLAIEELID